MMHIFTSERIKQITKVIIYSLNFIIAIKLCLKSYQRLIALITIYWFGSSDQYERRDIIKYSVEVFFTIVLLCYYIVFLLNINTINRVVAAYIVISLYIVFELEFNYIFITGSVIGLQVIIDRLQMY